MLVSYSIFAQCIISYQCLLNQRLGCQLREEIPVTVAVVVVIATIVRRGCG